MDIKIVPIENPKQLNLILGQSHFIKTVEDLHEAMVSTVPGAKWSRSSIVDTKSITLPAVARSIDVRKRPVKDSPVASGAVVDCRTLQCTR